MQDINSIDWAKVRPDLNNLDDPFDIKTYIEQRAVYKIKRYFLLSKQCGWRYKAIAVSILILSALVPVVINTSMIKAVEYRMLLASISSFLVVVLFSIESVFNYRELWKNYKNAEDEIMQELNLFHTSAEPYNSRQKNERERLLVLRVESIIIKERKDSIEKLTSKIKELEKGPQATG